jgi:hypothetical protein
MYESMAASVGVIHNGRDSPPHYGDRLYDRSAERRGDDVIGGERLRQSRPAR